MKIFVCDFITCTKNGVNSFSYYYKYTYSLVPFPLSFFIAWPDFTYYYQKFLSNYDEKSGIRAGCSIIFTKGVLLRCRWYHRRQVSQQPRRWPLSFPIAKDVESVIVVVIHVVKSQERGASSSFPRPLPSDVGPSDPPRETGCYRQRGR